MNYELGPNVFLNTLLSHQYMCYFIPRIVCENHRISLWKFITEALAHSRLFLALQNASRIGGRVQVPPPVWAVGANRWTQMEHKRPQETRWTQPHKGLQGSWEGSYEVHCDSLHVSPQIAGFLREKSQTLVPSSRFHWDSDCQRVQQIKVQLKPRIKHKLEMLPIVPYVLLTLHKNVCTSAEIPLI